MEVNYFPKAAYQISENSPIGNPILFHRIRLKQFFIWNDATISDIPHLAQKYDTLGNKLWDENGVIVSYPAIAYETTTDGQGGIYNYGLYK